MAQAVCNWLCLEKKRFSSQKCLKLLLNNSMLEGIDQFEGRIDVSEKPLTHLKLTPPPHSGVGKAWIRLMI